MKTSNRRINPIILEGNYKLTKKSNGVNVVSDVLETSQQLFKPQLEKWICRNICNRDNVMLVESIRLLHKPEIIDISNYMLAKLSGRRVNNEELKDCFAEALVELNLDINELRKIDREKLTKIKQSPLYKRK